MPDTARHRVETGKGSSVPICEWFAACVNMATGVMPHLIGAIPICDRCRAEVDALNENPPAPICGWFAMCANLATGTMPHPIGDVPICDLCRAKVDSLR